MKTLNHKKFRIIVIIFLFNLMIFHSAEARVGKEGGKTYIVDRTGEKWDITQAVSIGFDPHKFEFGIGRNAFQPLDEGDWQSNSDNNPSNLRIIGVARDRDAHAYSVNRLRYHETANTFLGEDAVVAGY